MLDFQSEFVFFSSLAQILFGVEGMVKKYLSCNSYQLLRPQISILLLDTGRMRVCAMY